MQRLREDTKRRVREANDIVDIIGSTVQLKRAGKSYKGLCPFHDEKTPSFHVNPERQTFKCFGCGEGGDVFTFIEKTEHVEFKEALSLLADRAGIPLKMSPGAASEAAVAREQRIHLYRAQTLAASFFTAKLKSAAGTRARDYLKRRSLDASAEKWGLGFAPDAWDAFVSIHATSPSKQRWMAAAGLARTRETGGVYDVFRDRVMFPIADGSGRIVGFGGRMLGDGEPKYLNTPDTAIFAKGRLLYGLDRSRESIEKTGKALVVEGYTDVIRCHEYGFSNAVATLGTALGMDHVRLLRRFGTKKVIVVYDADAPGIKAAERALEILIEADMAGAVVNLEGGLDPCDYLQQRSGEEFTNALDSAQDLFEFKITRAAQRHDLTNLDERAEVAHELMAVVSKSNDRVKRALLRQRIAEKLGVPEKELEFDQQPRRPASSSDSGRRKEQPTGLMTKAERDLAWLLLKHPGGISVVLEDVEVSKMTDPVAREVVESIEGLHKRNEILDDRNILDHLTDEVTEFAVSALESEEISKPDLLEGRLRTAAAALTLLRIPDRVKLDRRIKEAEHSGEEGRIVELLKERSELERTRHRLKSRGRSRPDPNAAGDHEEGHS